MANAASKVVFRTEIPANLPLLAHWLFKGTMTSTPRLSYRPILERSATCPTALSTSDNQHPVKLGRII
jgi:hypothetical protein